MMLQNFVVVMLKNKKKQTKKKQKTKEACGAFSCLASQFDDKFEWVQCGECEDWFHIMCEGIPGCEYPQVELMVRYICSKWCELDEHSIYEYIVCKIGSQHNEMKCPGRRKK